MRSLILTTLILCTFAFFNKAHSTETKPNIICVFIDDMGYSDFSCFGGKVKTQHIDQLAAEGMKFTQFYVNSPICSPSRVALTTGQYPQRWRITSYLNNRKSNNKRGMAQWLDPKAPTLARQLKNHGYATGHFGKWHMGGQRDVADAPAISEYGFDQSLTNFEGIGPKLLPLTLKPDQDPSKPGRIWADAERLGEGFVWMQRSEITGGFVDAALTFIDKSAADKKPFFINLWPDDVHGPFWPPLDKWGGDKRALYQGVLDSMDEQLARLFDRVRNDPKLRDNTIITVCSDNGHEPGAGSSDPLRGAKTWMYEGGIRSPLVVWAPGFMPTEKTGSTNGESVFSAIDLNRSLYQLAGIEPVTQLDGEDVSAALIGRSTQGRKAPLFWRRPPDRPGFSHGYKEDNPDLAVRDGKWKFLVNHDGSDPQLYDLEKNIAESDNLAAKFPEVATKLDQSLRAWNASMPTDSGSPTPPKPNIVVIMVDDMGFSDIACYGGEIPTPNLDKLAANGAKFSQFHNTGRCCPTRASLLTGLYSHQAGIGWMTADQGLPGYRGRLAENCVTIAEVLKPAGYLTAITGKWHVGFDENVNPKKRGFDRSLNLAMGGVHFSNQSGQMETRKLYRNGVEITKDDPSLSPPWYGSDLWTEEGIRYIDEAVEKKKPFFLYLAHVAPHFPCMAPEKTIAKYRGKYLKGWDKLREERYARQIESGLISKEWPLTPRPEKIPAWDSFSDADKKRYDDMMAIYAAMIDEVDKNVGKLVTALEQRQQLDNTLILFLSDNGGNAETGVKGKYEGENPGDAHSNVFIGQCWAHLNNTPFRKYKHYNHEGGTSSPLIAHWPAGIKAQKEWVTTPAHLIDIMATCVDLSAANYPKKRNDQAIPAMEGTSLKPLFANGGKLPERALFFEHEGNAAVRKGDLKLVRQGRNGSWELFDLKKDRSEQNDLSQSRVSKVEELKKLWRDWATSHQVLPYPNKKKKNKK